jgi:hypothetical protein
VTAPAKLTNPPTEIGAGNAQKVAGTCKNNRSRGANLASLPSANCGAKEFGELGYKTC